MPAPPILCSSPRRQRRALCLAAMACGVTGLRAQPAFEVRPWKGATPVLRLSDLDGKPWPLAALRGRVVLLNFWASWCEPCRAEMPSLERLASQQGSDALTVLAINFKESAPTVRRFLERQPLALPVLLDSDGAAAAQCRVRIFPSSLLVDRTGQARTVVVGEMDWAGPAAQSLLRPLLARP